jgi:hypothetical protein
MPEQPVVVPCKNQKQMTANKTEQYKQGRLFHQISSIGGSPSDPGDRRLTILLSEYGASGYERIGARLFYELGRPGADASIYLDMDMVQSPFIPHVPQLLDFWEYG